MHEPKDVKTVAVLGCGFIGFSWAVVFASHGRTVNLYNRPSQSLASVKERVRTALDFLCEEGVIDAATAVASLARVRTFDDLAAAVADADYVQDALPEDLDLKQRVFAEVATLTAPLRPNDIYGATKAAGEALVGAYSDQHGLDGVSLRISWVYGPRRRTDCLIRTLIDDALSGRPTRLAFGVGFHRQYIYVSDVVASILAALDAPSYPSRVYNVTGGSFDSLDEVGAVVQRVLPQARIEMKPGPDPVDTMQAEFDISSIRQDLGFAPEVGLEEGIRAYADWLQSRRAGPGQ